MPLTKSKRQSGRQVVADLIALWNAFLHSVRMAHVSYQGLYCNLLLHTKKVA